MKLECNCPEFYNDISESIRAFFPNEKIELTENGGDITVFEEKNGEIFTAKCVFGTFNGEGRLVQTGDSETEITRAGKRAAKLSVYSCLKNATGKTLPWGSLTGIRPTKLLREFSGNKKALTETFFLPEKKADLLEDIIKRQEEFFTLPKEDIDIYIGIPFCRTRCSYCSFSSTDSTKGEKLMKPYVAALKREIEETAELLKCLSRRVRCVYIGGGTPTALNEEMFADMLYSAKKHFNPYLEFTVEAGRPDTITENKLRVMKDCGVDRISINPQSMNDETLNKIGRSHSPEEIESCFSLAKSIGFKTVNTDLIAGLPGETPEMFFYTLDRVLALSPENITVHTLAIKRGSVMFEKGFSPKNEDAVRIMVEGALEKLEKENYHPYYLYRQKYMTGNFENIGYSLDGHIGVYNIDIMEETADILALGCGAVSKRIVGETIERAFNFKSIYEYNSRIDECLSRKKALFQNK